MTESEFIQDWVARMGKDRPITVESVAQYLSLREADKASIVADQHHWIDQNVSGNPVLMQAMKSIAGEHMPTRRTPEWKHGHLVPAGAIRVIETTVESIPNVQDMYCGTIRFADEAGVVFRMRAFAGGIAASLQVETRDNIPATYVFKHGTGVYSTIYKMRANSQAEAVEKLFSVNRHLRMYVDRSELMFSHLEPLVQDA